MLVHAMMIYPNPRSALSAASRSRHLLGISDMRADEIDAVLARAEVYLRGPEWEHGQPRPMSGRLVVNLFFEPSTRTRASFEIAAKHLGADVINLSIESSATKKGESLIDTVRVLADMRADLLVVRHAQSGAPALIARHVDCGVVNAGDGRHEHPTQALLDALVMRRHFGRLHGLVVAICGDILHSRVARSNILLLVAMGVIVRVVAPAPLLPSGIEAMGVEAFDRLESGLSGCDVVMLLRLQEERMSGMLLSSVREYFRFFGLDHRRLAELASSAMIMHPGPVRRGAEISSKLADDPERSLIRRQVELGIAVRMACLEACCPPDDVA